MPFIQLYAHNSQTCQTFAFAPVLTCPVLMRKLAVVLSQCGYAAPGSVQSQSHRVKILIQRCGETSRFANSSYQRLDLLRVRNRYILNGSFCTEIE